MKDCSCFENFEYKFHIPKYKHLLCILTKCSNIVFWYVFYIIMRTLEKECSGQMKFTFINFIYWFESQSNWTAERWKTFNVFRTITRCLIRSESDWHDREKSGGAWARWILYAPLSPTSLVVTVFVCFCVAHNCTLQHPIHAVIWAVHRESAQNARLFCSLQSHLAILKTKLSPACASYVHTSF